MHYVTLFFWNMIWFLFINFTGAFVFVCILKKLCQHHCDIFTVSNGPHEGELAWVKLRSYNTNIFKKSAPTFKTDVSLPIKVVAERIYYQHRSLYCVAIWFIIFFNSNGLQKCNLRWVKLRPFNIYVFPQVSKTF